MRTKTKKGLVNFKRKRSLGSVVPLLFLATGFNVVSANGIEALHKYENDKVNVVVQTITGTIVDADGIPLPGATVVIKGTSKGTQTDFDGNFIIDANAGDVLEISYVGFKTQEIVIGDQATISIALEQDIDALTEVVVVGYGKVKKSDLTGAVAKVTDKAFEEQPISRVEDALQGRLSGVTVAQSNGTPGSDTKIRVRGVNSVTGANAPLVIVDGIFGGDLRTINPNNIASIEVLKDASSLALYGSRGSNGVILVTTKKGKGKPKVEVDYFTSVAQLANSYDNRLSSGEFARRRNANATGGAIFSEEEIRNLDANPIDYEDELFRSATTNNIQLSVSGGDDKINYFISGNYVNQEGIMITNEFERYSLRSNLQSKINDKLKVGLNLYANRETDINNPNIFNRTFGGPVVQALTTDPTEPVFNSDGSLNITGFRFGNLDATSYIADIRRSDLQRQTDRINTNINLEYKIFEPLTYKLLVGLSLRNRSNEFLIKESTGLNDISNRAEVRNEKFSEYQFTNILNYNKSFGNHNLDAIAVYEFQASESSDNTSTFANISGDINDVALLDTSTTVEQRNFASNFGESGIQSFLGRLNYNYNGSLYITGALRIDESSRFLPDERVGYFPSAALAYSFKKMTFIENSSVFNDLKLRTSWGQVGNQNVPAGAFNDLRTPNPGTTIPILRRFGNPDITWETTTQIDAGIDVSLFNNRLNFSFDYFNKVTDDLLLRRFFDLRVDAELFTFENIGEVENKGFDIALNGDIIDTENFTWNSGLVFSFVENEVTKLFDDFTEIRQNVRAVDNINAPINIVELGAPLGQFRGATFAGINDAGESTYVGVDADGNVATGSLSEGVTPDLGVIGNGTPTTTWGFNNTFTYKNLDLNIFIRGAHGFDVYNQVAAALDSNANGNFRNTLVNTPDITGNLLNSSKYVENGGFVRLSNLSLAYTIRNPFKGLSSAKISVSGQNLLLITDYSGYDPEVSSSNPFGQNESGQDNSDVSSGIDLGAIPNPRTITLGLKLSF
ncbi:SusC/RagA family TonB-linked outer membrane protein [Aquimarina agarivorans]|uniref:SusC/RagA family TonB-linked outer membrane protein n=1 Tax=Aquimarina agarivorans TaxID=980584 RepID=UPI000248E610|nr:SusC/RagA family TonB-linked outer membrane protein [Aquimarina agarivorans]